MKSRRIGTLAANLGVFRMEPFELALRAMAAVQLLFLAAVLLIRREGNRTTRGAALLPIGLAAYMITSAPGADTMAAWLILPLTVLCVANPLWFWLLGEALFADDLRIELRWFVPALLIIAAGLWHEMAAPETEARWAGAVFQLGALGAVAATVWSVVDGKHADLIERRRRWRTWFMFGVGSYGASALLLLVLFGGQLPPMLARANVAFILGCSLALSLWLVARSGAPDAAAPGDAQAAAARAPRLVDAALVERVRHAMQVECLYRREDLTVAELARAIGSQEYLVRRAINGSLGYRNFNDFLHALRLGEAVPRLLSQRELPILTIALDVGYGSIGPFNRAFRARFGMTPSDYRAQSQQAPSMSAQT
jgi:AraC-like DNA-binding protein